jgi:murein DD-endopeptidase MepM/ murein hydrolase activator NlpD
LLALTACLALGTAPAARAASSAILPVPPPYWSELPPSDEPLDDGDLGQEGLPAPRVGTAVESATPPVEPLRLLFPVPGGKRTGLEKHFLAHRGRRLHHAVDIGAPRNSPIRAVADGTIQRLRRSRRGGISLEEIDRTGRYCFYYAHLQRYAPGLKAGQEVSRDDLLGFVGSTGAARGPHLHFSVLELGEEKECWKGTLVDPYPLLDLAPPSPPRAEEPSRVLAE